MNRQYLMVVFLGLFLIIPLWGQRPGEISYKDESIMPAGRIGERIQSLIATVNANDPERVRRFISEECTARFRNIAPMEEHIGVFSGMFRQTGGIDFHSIRSYVPERKGETVVILQDRFFQAWRAFVLGFSPDEDRLFARIQFNDARTPTNVKEEPLTEKELIRTVREMLDRLCQKDAFSGTVLLAKRDEVMFEKACGEASKRFHVPNTIDTKFNLGSMNKMFTSTAITQLVEKGRLSYEDTIDKYVDESWLPKEVTSKITIHHLLTHTSGLGDYFNKTYQQGSRLLFRAVDDFKPLVKGDRSAFAPGRRFRYSNTGMLLLGVVIESITGGSYFDYIKENIYAPAGMKNSDSYEMDYPVENLAIGYSPAPDSPYGWQNNYYKHVIKGGPAGGGFSTVHDLLRFARALLNGKLVSLGSLKAMWTDHSGENYGYGFGISEGPAGKVVGHSGGFAGINANLDIFVDKGFIVAVMSNVDRGASPLAGRINQLIARVK